MKLVKSSTIEEYGVVLLLETCPKPRSPTSMLGFLEIEVPIVSKVFTFRWPFSMIKSVAPESTGGFRRLLELRLSRTSHASGEKAPREHACQHTLVIIQAQPEAHSAEAGAFSNTRDSSYRHDLLPPTHVARTNVGYNPPFIPMTEPWCCVSHRFSMFGVDTGKHTGAPAYLLVGNAKETLSHPKVHMGSRAALEETKHDKTLV